MLFVIGLDDPTVFQSGFYSSKWKPMETPTNPAFYNKIWNVLVSVPSEDIFGLSNVVTETTLDGDAKAEVYTSHGFLHAYSYEASVVSSESLLRKKSNDDVKNYINDLCKAFGLILQRNKLK